MRGYEGGFIHRSLSRCNPVMLLIVLKGGHVTSLSTGQIEVKVSEKSIGSTGRTPMGRSVPTTCITTYPRENVVQYIFAPSFTVRLTK